MFGPSIENFACVCIFVWMYVRENVEIAEILVPPGKARNLAVEAAVEALREL